MNSVLQHTPKKLKLHQQRAADLRASMLLLELGARIRVGAPVVDTQPVKGGGA